MSSESDDDFVSSAINPPTVSHIVFIVHYNYIPILVHIRCFLFRYKVILTLYCISLSTQSFDVRWKA